MLTLGHVIGSANNAHGESLHLVEVGCLGGAANSLEWNAGQAGENSWGGRIFCAGMQLSLPVVASLLITNIALGILTRAASQLNLFGVDFSIALSVRFLMLALTMPYLADPLDMLFSEAFGMMRKLTTNIPAF